MSAIKVALARRALSRLLKRLGPNVVIYSYWRLEAASAIALLKAKGLLRHFFVRAHGGDIYSSTRYPFESLVHQHADAVFPVSESGHHFLVAVKGFPGTNIQVQRLGITIPTTLSARSNDQVLRVVSCSNVIGLKRVHLIARFLAALPRRVEWTHFGDGDQMTQVLAEVNRFDHHHQAVMKGRVPNRTVLDFFRDNPIDLFINLSETEGVPVSIMEALSFGVPVIATDVGGTSEIIDPSCGVLVPSDCDYDLFSRAVGRLTAESTRDSFRHAARRQAERLCDAAVNYAATYKLMDEICDGALGKEGRR
jgi:glycosyltransferase involved in cell wall biosynthesis